MQQSPLPPDLWFIAKYDAALFPVVDAARKPFLQVCCLSVRSLDDPACPKDSIPVAGTNEYRVSAVVAAEDLGPVMCITVFKENPSADASPLTAQDLMSKYGIQDVVTDPTQKKPTHKQLLALSKEHDCLRFLKQMTRHQGDFYASGEVVPAFAFVVLAAPDDVDPDVFNEHGTASAIMKLEDGLELSIHIIYDSSVYADFYNGLTSKDLLAITYKDEQGNPEMTLITFPARPNNEALKHACAYADKNNGIKRATLN